MGHRVLVVEDDHLDRQIIEHAVAKCSPAHVMRASNVAEATTLLEASGAHYFSVIFVDLGLPGEPGTEIVRRVRAASAFVPIVVITASRQEADLYASYKLGASAYMIKAPDEEQFTDAIETAAKFWLNINCVPREEAAVRRAEAGDVFG